MLPRRLFLAGAATLGSTAESMTVILDWLLGANHAALFAADHTGAFARHGLAVTLVAPSDPDSPVRLVAAGQADLAIGYGTQINLVASAGLPVVRIATLIGAPLNTVMALGGGRIRTLADLRGGKIGLSVGGVEDALLGVMLQSAGLQPGDVTQVKVNYDMVAALLTGRLDAAIGAFRNAEVLQVRQLGRTPVVFLPEEHGVPRTTSSSWWRAAAGCRTRGSSGSWPRCRRGRTYCSPRPTRCGPRLLPPTRSWRQSWTGHAGRRRFR